MAKTDVVKHDLPKALLAAQMNVEEDLEPVPFPKGPSRPMAEALLVAPPVTSLVSDEERVTAPFRSVGKMGMVYTSGAKKYGTGWVVAKRAFITAAHCVHYSDFGGWIKEGKFVPRFNVRAGKIYEVETVYALKGWVDSAERAYDMAVCVVTENFADTEPPLAFDAGILPGLSFLAIGYPFRPIPGHDFNGKRMWKSAGAFDKVADSLWWAANNFTGGSSGGPWCEPDNRMVVSGITAAREDDNPNVAESPQFANGFQNLYNVVKDL